ncbi:hypothetical protein [Nitrospira moscoviensis]|uniref:Uncharacterized protein n=1 Tax=Nitrospira moscoviensis TaxID=42253 RepID=A0A0K2GBR4_NITMO|nr:hypothetical protein [Nitrospira moscoviensis]ALA58390.1 hypothetical protein NITMOv2_1973 [Nitrospira moscoviensis]
MSWVYWGIVAGLVAMVVDLLICIGLASPRTKASHEAGSGGADQPSRAVKPTMAVHGRAA